MPLSVFFRLKPKTSGKFVVSRAAAAAQQAGTDEEARF